MPLHEKIVQYIRAHEPVTWEQLQERATMRGIDPRVFLDAMDKVNTHRDIHARELTGGMTYSIRVIRPYKPRYEVDTPPPAPPLIEGINDASHPIFDGMDYSHLFLTPKQHYKKYGCQHGARRRML
jgi:hypothetical protein